MLRLVVEFSADELAKSPEFALLKKVKSMEMVHILRESPGEFAAIARVEVADPTIKIEDVLSAQNLQSSAKVEAEQLDQENQTTFDYFVKIRPNARELSRVGAFPIYLSTPFEFREGKMKITFLGTSKQMKAHLRNLEKQSRLRYKVVSLTDAKFPPNSPMGRLTEKQRRVLITAYKLGYYDVPRRITSQELAERFKLVKSTLSAHVRKAERRLLTEILRES